MAALSGRDNPPMCSLVLQVRHQLSGLEEMMEERGVDVDHTTIYRWVQHFAPEMEKRLRWYYRPSGSTSWQIDETYVKVKGVWKYLYRAIDKEGRTLDFFLSHTRSTAMAKRFLCKALRG